MEGGPGPFIARKSLLAYICYICCRVEPGFSEREDTLDFQINVPMCLSIQKRSIHFINFGKTAAKWTKGSKYVFGICGGHKGDFGKVDEGITQFSVKNNQQNEGGISKC